MYAFIYLKSERISSMKCQKCPSPFAVVCIALRTLMGVFWLLVVIVSLSPRVWMACWSSLLNIFLSVTILFGAVFYFVSLMRTSREISCMGVESFSFWFGPKKVNLGASHWEVLLLATMFCGFCVGRMGICVFCVIMVLKCIFWGLCL